MLNYGFVKVAGAIPFGKVCGIEHNTTQIIKLIKEASLKKTSIIVFPELSVTSYTCGDLFHQGSIIEKSKKALLKIASATKDIKILSIVGVPIINNNKLYNCAAVINKGEIIGIVPKSFIPGYREFYEPRWFSGIETDFYKNIILENKIIPFGNDLLFIDKDNEKFIIGIEICEDLWMQIPPSSYQSLAGAIILCNLSASNILTGKSEYRKEIVKNQSSRCIAGYVYVSSGMGESTKDVVFDADAAIVENGVILSESERFLRKNQIIYSDIDIEKLTIDRTHQNIGQSTKSYRFIDFESQNKNISIQRSISPYPFIPEKEDLLDIRCNEIFNIQSAGLAKRFETLSKNTKAIIGISGGLDSTLALLVTIKTFKILKKNLKDIIAITMPGFGTSNKTYNNTLELCNALKITLKELDIKDISTLMIKKIDHSLDKKDTVYENIQARARTYILMTAANKYNGIVIGTGDLSEIALGFATYNGDHISMYNVNSSVPKTLVKFLIKWIANNEFKDIKNILTDILEQPISPELIPSEGRREKDISQKTEKLIGPYELHDFFLYYLIRFGFNAEKILFLAEKAFGKKYEKSIIKKWLKVFYNRFFKNQWKRDCVPAGPKVGSVDLSPRGSWRMPSEAEISTFLNDDDSQ